MSSTIDGDTTTTSFWAGAKDGDSITVTFNKLYTVSEITIYTNNLIFNSLNGITTSGIRVQISNDNSNYKAVGLVYLGGLKAPITCSSSSFFANKSVRCTLSTPILASSIKLLVTSDFSSTDIYEIEVMGK